MGKATILHGRLVLKFTPAGQLDQAFPKPVIGLGNLTLLVSSSFIVTLLSEGSACIGQLLPSTQCEPKSGGYYKNV